MTRRLTYLLAGAGLGVALLSTLLLWPVESRRGIDFEVETLQMRGYEKGIDFLSRHLQTKRLASEITAGVEDPRDRSMVIFAWVVEHVKPTPAGFPVVDDHPFHILVRGYGEPDQRSEAFALLASYVGIPATAVRLGASGEVELVVAIARIGEELHLFDVVHGFAFQDAAGRPIPLDRLIDRPELVERGTRGLEIDGRPYASFLADAASIRPNFNRMELQKPWSRVWFETSKLVPGFAR